MQQPNIPPSQGQRSPGAVSLHPDDMITPFEDLRLDEVIRRGESRDDKPRGDKDDYRHVPVRTKVLGFSLETRRIANYHNLKYVALVQRLSGKHGLHIIRENPLFEELKAAYQELSGKLNEVGIGDQVVEMLEEEARVQYRRANTKRVIKISSYATVADEVSELAPILGLSFGQSVLACSIVSLATHPQLTEWAKRAVTEEAASVWRGVQARTVQLTIFR